MKKVIVFLLSLIIALVPVSTAYSYNADYLNISKWSDSNKTVSASINKTGAFGVLDGFYKYYIDDVDNCIYFYFSINEDNIYDNSDVTMEIVISNTYEEYLFVVDENGLVSDYSYADKFFDVYSNFTTYDNHDGDYIVAVDINNGFDENDVSIAVHTRGKYVIDDLRNIKVVASHEVLPSAQSPQKTTAKSSKVTTTKRLVKTSTAKNTTKKGVPTTTGKSASTTTVEYVTVFEEVFDSTTVNNVDNKSRTKATTKASKKNNSSCATKKSYTVGTTHIEDDTADYVADNTTVLASTESSTDNKKNNPLLYGAIGVAILGIIFILIGTLSKKKAKPDDNKADNFNF